MGVSKRSIFRNFSSTSSAGVYTSHNALETPRRGPSNIILLGGNKQNVSDVATRMFVLVRIVSTAAYQTRESHAWCPFVHVHMSARPYMSDRRGSLGMLLAEAVKRSGMGASRGAHHFMRARTCRQACHGRDTAWNSLVSGSKTKMLARTRHWGAAGRTGGASLARHHREDGPISSLGHVYMEQRAESGGRRVSRRRS